MTPLGCAILELTVWWASRTPRPTDEETIEMAARIAYRWWWWLEPGQPQEIARQAVELAWQAKAGWRFS